MKQILITYAPQGGYTETIALNITQALAKHSCKIVPGSKLSDKDIQSHDIIIIGIATLGNDSWNAGNTDLDVSHLQKILSTTQLQNKKIALFGLGNAILYPQNFVDDMGIYAEQIQQKGGTLVGYTSTEGYTFKESKAIYNNTFCGLALDNDTEPDKTKKRLETWISQISHECDL